VQVLRSDSAPAGPEGLFVHPEDLAEMEPVDGEGDGEREEPRRLKSDQKKSFPVLIALPADDAEAHRGLEPCNDVLNGSGLAAPAADGTPKERPDARIIFLRRIDRARIFR